MSPSLQQSGRRRFIGVTIAFAAILALQLGAPPSGAAPLSSVSGTVVSPDGEPLEDICINMTGDDGDFIDGTRSDADGNYRVAARAGVPFRVLFLDCSDAPVWVAQWHRAAPDFDSATSITLEDGQELSGVDATLAPGGTISGTVDATSVGPVHDLCVIAVAGAGDSARGVGRVETGPDGSYTLGGLPAGQIRVLFEDCNDVGPYAPQWFDGADTFGAATVIDVTGGSARSGVDATLQRASVISGTVTDSEGAPLADVCVQAVASDRFGGSDTTAEDGSYSVVLATGGTYRVQFVDCNDDPTHRGRWFGGGADPSSAQPVEVADEGETADISSRLELGAAASLSGTATNIRGDAMATACAVLYLPDEFVEFRPIEPDGSYRFDGFGSGTYAVAFVGCADDDDSDAQMLIPDPGGSDVAYGAIWRGGQLLLLDNDEAPDPIRQGAELLTVAAGEEATVDECFGCDAISLQLSADGNSIAATFTTTGISLIGPMPSASSAARPESAVTGLEYSLSCRADGVGASSEPEAVTGMASPLAATDLDPATDYTCSMSATSGGLLVAGSEVLGISTSAAVTTPNATPAPPDTAADPRSTAVAATPRTLSFAG